MEKLKYKLKSFLECLKLLFIDLFKVEKNDFDTRLTDIKIQSLSEEVVIPTLATNGSVGFDFYSLDTLIIEPMSSTLIHTGLAFELPANIELQIRSRSGLSVKYNVFVLNAPGTIDSDYRGEVMICLYNLGKEPFSIKKGDRVAQGVLNTVVLPRFVKVNTLSHTERGSNGFGSTGV